MEKIKFVEITIKRNYSIKIDNYFQCSNYVTKVDTNNRYGFINSMQSREIVSAYNDISYEILNYKYMFKEGYNIFFIYDILNDAISIDFLTRYGEQINNRFTWINVITYIRQSMVNGWKNAINRETIKDNYNYDGDYNHVFNTIENIKKAFHVEYSRAAIIVKVAEYNQLSFKVIDLSNYNNVEKLDSGFKNIMELISNNCNNDFENISKKIDDNFPFFKENNSIRTICLFDLISDLVKKYSKNINHKYTLRELWEELHISKGGLDYKRNNGTFDVNECLYMAIKFGLSLVQTNDLLILNDHPQLGNSKRDDIIINCMQNKKNLEELNNDLKSNGFNQIIV